MPREGCRICRFWKKYPYKLNDRTFFETKARQGASLRKLELLLESYGCRARKDLISKHLKECLGITRKDRQIEKEIKRKDRKVGQKLRDFFIRPTEEPKIPQKCPHMATTSFFDLRTERIYTRCKKCGAILNRSVDPHRRRGSRSRRKNLIIYGSLRK